ncbi:hypothetical protein KCTCHS21_29190 [Cohnella abietis]|uniref:Uncharacterized protein n=1 Tax=Cohnella abietis TaxID=2507935 RepID=A0A3T1D5Y9_9BACL|nr:hypothetical protein KCTCHS21_29190 [Cohnella abietis]
MFFADVLLNRFKINCGDAYHTKPNPVQININGMSFRFLYEITQENYRSQ